MSLRWRSLEQKLKRRVRSEVRASAVLRRESRHAHRGHRWWNIRVTPNTYRLVFWFVGLNFFSRRFMPLEQVQAFIWLWAMGAALWRAVALQSALYFGPELNVFNHLPMTDSEIFSAQWRKFLRGALWPAVDFAVLYGALALRLGAGWQAPAVGLLFGAFQGLFNVGFATCLFGFGVRRGLPLGALGFFLCAMGIMFFGATAPGMVGWFSAAGFWVPPAGWIHYALGLSLTPGIGSALIPCLITGTILAAFPLARQRLQQRYALNEVILANAFRSTATGEAAALRLRDYGQQFSQPEDVARASITTGEFLATLDWRKAGVVERLIAKCLTPRERTIAEFLTAARPGWTKSLRGLLMAGILLLIVSQVFSLQFLSGVGVMVFAVVFVVMMSNQGWRGFALAAPVGLPPPIYAYFPLSFAEVHRTLLKIALGRLLVLLPFLAFGAYFLLRTSQFQVSAILLTGSKIVILVIIAQPVVAILPFSAASNDSNRWRFALPALGYLLLALACGAGFVFVSNVATAVACGLGGAVLCGAAPWLYAWRFNRNKFDLIPAPRQNPSAPLARG